MSSTAQETAVPTGTWNADPVHSSLSFEVKYAVNTFRGEVREFEIKLEDGRLTGAARIASLSVKDENLEAHLQSPDFFDAASHPEVTFDTRVVRREGDRVWFEGEITFRGIARPTTLEGTITGPAVDHFGSTRIGLDLHAVIDRTEFGMNWNMPLPNGEPALANDVTLHGDLTLVEAS